MRPVNLRISWSAARGSHAVEITGAAQPMPTTTPEHDERIAKMTFSSVYPHYVTKVEKEGRDQRG